MTNDSKRRHVFISHHHKDDEHVEKLTKLLSKDGYDVRNSSIRVNPKNAERLAQKKVKDETIKRLLRMKISWASTTIVLIGQKTHERKWVNWEIKQAHEQGKRIVGVFERGGTNNDIPDNFEKYGSSLQAWNSKGIISAIDGSDTSFQNPDGTLRQAPHSPTVTTC
ncbi:MAG: TIR domain-containing protein [Candidatus Thiodiazotropha lotti]|nr:TIR domain-containing protein [Candidatus Thiodiazotropha lotti]MCW4186843.1 TIR domain-containing protein [Candidatus Thiodiazotropha lotti]